MKDKIQRLWNEYDPEHDIFSSVGPQMNYIDGRLLELIELLERRVDQLDDILVAQGRLVHFLQDQVGMLETSLNTTDMILDEHDRELFPNRYRR